MFDSAVTWRSANTFCQTPNCTSGFCGALAAARTQGESDLLNSLAGTGIRYWIAANSLSPDKIWRWEGYSATVNFNQVWITLADLSFSLHTDQVILAGRQAPYAWDFAISNTSLNYFICRKDACSPNQDIVDGLCSSEAASLRTSSSPSLTWVAAPVVVGVVVLVVALGMLYLYHYRNDKFNIFKRRIRESLPLRRAASADALRRVSELKEENDRLRTQLRASISGSDNFTSYSGSPAAQPRSSLPGLSPPSAIPTALSPSLPTVASLPRIRKGVTIVPGMILPELPTSPAPPAFDSDNAAALEAGLQRGGGTSMDTVAFTTSFPAPPPALRGLGFNRVGPAPPLGLPAFGLPRPSLVPGEAGLPLSTSDSRV